MGLPVINLEFKKLAQTVDTRAERGILAIIVQDATDTTFDQKVYTDVSEVDADDWTAANYKDICAAFLANPYKVIVIRLATSATSTAVAGALENVPFNWVCTNVSSFQTALSTAVKTLNTENTRARRPKALVAGVSNPNDPHVVNVSNTTVTLKGESTTTSIEHYLPRLGGLLAACPLTESVTYKPLDDLDDIAEVSNIDTAIENGGFCLFKDDDCIRVARGVNSLKTLSDDQTEDMKKITVVEGMDIMQEDIIKTFKANYLGRAKNTADNQALLVAEILAYFKELEQETIITMDEDDTVEIDVQAMRDAWTNAGVDVSDLTDAQVKRKTFRAKVFVKASCMVLDAMEDLVMVVTLG